MFEELSIIRVSKLALLTKQLDDKNEIEELKEAVAAFNSASVAKVVLNDEEKISKLSTLVSKLEESA